jgi:hypothetical protein
MSGSAGWSTTGMLNLGRLLRDGSALNLCNNNNNNNNHKMHPKSMQKQSPDKGIPPHTSSPSSEYSGRFRNNLAFISFVAHTQNSITLLGDVDQILGALDEKIKLQAGKMNCSVAIDTLKSGL